MASYAYSGTVQHFKAGSSGGNYTITAYGASGATQYANLGYAGGLGAQSGGTFKLAPNEQLKLIVGGQGSKSSAGGGGSFVLASTDGGRTYSALLVAGGGGGAAFQVPGHGGYSATSGPGNGSGGAGGHYRGAGGYYGNGGGGAGIKSGGSNGLGQFSGAGGPSYSAAGGQGAFAGQFGNGGFGGGGGPGQFGAGGGGGYTGGAGGAGYNVVPPNPAEAGHGGTSFDAGTPIAADTKAAVRTGNGLITITAVCYVSGTAIRVLRGGAAVDVAVEDLSAGDIAVTASGAHRAIKWLAHTTIDCTAAVDPRQVRPIRIAADAFGEGKPARDLRVSPDHAIAISCLDEVLVPAFAFLNGATVTQDRDDSVTYWHVELEGGHDILLAEGLAAESYLDCGNRGFFAGVGGAMDPGLDAAGSCRERTTDPVLLTAIRARLRKQALALGWRFDAAELGGLRLIADGATILPDADGLAARFLLPVAAKDVWLVSAASVPWDVSDAADGRRLGLCLASLAVGDGLGVQRTVALDDPRLADGFHTHETGAFYRWTDGRAQLDPDLWAGCRGHVFVRVALARPCIPSWRAPPQMGAGLRIA